MVRILNRGGNNDGRGPSDNIWGTCPWDKLMADPNIGYGLFDDFLNWTISTAGWVVAGTNPAASLLATEVGGVLRVGTAGADNDEGYLTSGNNTAGLGKIYSTTPKELWFEARVRPYSITDVGCFIGLAEEGLAAADSLTNDDAALASKDFVGFHADTAAPANLDSVWRLAGQAAGIHEAASQVLVAGTWYKMGLHYREDDLLEYYIDAVLQSTQLDVSAATNFPDGEELAVLIGVHDGAGVAKHIDIDWVKYAQRV